LLFGRNLQASINIYFAEQNGKSLLKVLAPELEEALFVVRESGTAFEMHLSISDNPDQTVVICHISKSLSAEARAAQMAVLDLMRSMMRGLAVSVYIT
jgi:hypothetical protein